MQFPSVGRQLGESREAWWRGPARHYGEWIVADRSRLEEWHPTTKLDRVTLGDPIVELANIRSPADAVGFAEQFGLLHLPPADNEPWRETFREMSREARLLGEILELYVDVQAAMLEREPETYAALRRQWEDRLAPMYATAAKSDREFVMRAATAAGDLVSHGLRRTGTRMDEAVIERLGVAIDDDGPIAFTFDSYVPDLLGHCYHQLAVLMTGGVPLRICPECGRYFSIPPRARGRDRTYCIPEHGNRFRVRKFRKENPR